MDKNEKCRFSFFCTPSQYIFMSYFDVEKVFQLLSGLHDILERKIIIL